MTEQIAPDFSKYTREDIVAFLNEISQNIVASSSSYFHSMLALNTLLRLPHARTVFDKELVDQARDLWVKLRSTGLHLTDPPLLFAGSSPVVSDAREQQDGAAAPRGNSKGGKQQRADH